MDPDHQELYRLVRENNKMLHSMRRHAFWGGIFKLMLYIAALAIPVLLYFNYLYPIVQQMNATLTSVTGKKVELEGQFKDWAAMIAQFRERITGAPATTTVNQ